MKYANEIKEIINAFSPEPLQNEEMDKFYCDETMEYRMSDKYSIFLIFVRKKEAVKPFCY